MRFCFPCGEQGHEQKITAVPLILNIETVQLNNVIKINVRFNNSERSIIAEGLLFHDYQLSK